MRNSNKQHDPKVTVVMSVYNGERFLKQSIDSILNQTFTDFEFVIINDGSTDKTGEILESYTDPRMLVIDQDNMGLIYSLNRGIKTARGEYIARMDADDISMPTRFERQIEFLERHPSVGVLGITSRAIDEAGNVLRNIKHPMLHEIIMERILLDNCFVHSSVMLRKKLLETYGDYSKDAVLGEDYELFLRLSKVTRFANLDASLHNWRENYSTGISVVTRSEQIVVRDRIRKIFLEKNFVLNNEFINWVLTNFKKNLKDVVLSEVLFEISRAIPFFTRLLPLKLKIQYYLLISCFCQLREKTKGKVYK